MTVFQGHEFKSVNVWWREAFGPSLKSDNLFTMYKSVS